MPLIDTPWTRGKCGFKLIQYGSIGIASIGSKVGVNSNIIEDGENGFLIQNDDEWLGKITKLILDEPLRIKMGKKARDKILHLYDTCSNYNLLKIYIDSCC